MLARLFKLGLLQGLGHAQKKTACAVHCFRAPHHNLGEKGPQFVGLRYKGLISAGLRPGMGVEHADAGRIKLFQVDTLTMLATSHLLSQCPFWSQGCACSRQGALAELFSEVTTDY